MKWVRSLRPPLLVRWVDRFMARLIRPESLIIQEWKGSAGSILTDSHARNLGNGVAVKKKRLCLFSHFDRDGKIDDYVLFYLKSLRELGVDIVFISTAENLIEAEIEKIRPYCLHLIQRKNITLDFGSWKIGWMRAGSLFNASACYEQLILANDSVYGPLFPMTELFAAMEGKSLDLWGVSSSREQGYHLQSYFLVIESRALKSEALANFWDRFVFFRSKARIIQEYEIGLTRLALAEPWKIGAWVEFDEEKHLGVNSTLFAWDKLIEEDRFPFLKTEVLKLNRAQSARMPFWDEILRAHSSYPVDLIREHLSRVVS